jgi:hypothetical protein
MTNPVLDTLAEIAQRERKAAVRDGDYGWAIVTAIVESWATNASNAAE